MTDTKNTVHKRLNDLIGMLGETKNSFARAIGVASTQVYNTCDGRNAPSHGMYELIAEIYPQVNLKWLITGRGKALINLDEDEAHDKATFEQDARELLDILKVLEKKMDKMKRQYKGIRKKRAV